MPILDVYACNNGVLERQGTKEFSPATKPLNKWVERPKASVPTPPMAGALNLSSSRCLEMLAPNALGYLFLTANDVQHAGQGTFLLSSCAGAGHGWSVTPDNFLSSLAVLAARKLVAPTWLNNRDEFSIPNTAHPEYSQFSLDAVVYTLFNGANNTSSLGNIQYKDKTWDIINHFFWVDPAEMMKWSEVPAGIYSQLQRAEPRFVAKWIADNYGSLSPDAQKVLNLGTLMVKESMRFRMSADPKYQLDRWDAGWYQVRMGLYGRHITFQPTQEMCNIAAEFQSAYRELTLRLRPMIYELGILPKEVELS